MTDEKPKMTWGELELFVQERIQELLTILEDPRYRHRHAVLQQFLAVMLAREQEVQILASIEREGASDDGYSAAQARARLHVLFQGGDRLC